jgi:hypothetical protein
VDAPQQLAVGDAGGGEEAVVAGYQVVGAEHLFEVVAGVDRELAFLLVARPEPALQLAAHALERGGGDDAFGSAADAEEDVGPGVGPRGGDGARHVAVGDEAKACARGAHLGDELGVAIAIEDDGGDVAHRLALGLGHRVEVLGGGAGEVDDTRSFGPDRDLLHVDAGAGVEHGAAFAHRDDRQRVSPAEGCQRGAVDGVDRDVGHRRVAGADLLAVEEHGRLVLLALADHHDTVHRHALQHQAHGVDRRTVGSLLVASADPPARCQGGRLGDPRQLECEVAIGSLSLSAHARTIPDLLQPAILEG